MSEANPRPTLGDTSRPVSDSRPWVWAAIAFLLGCGVGAMAELGARVARLLAAPHGAAGPAWAGIGGWLMLGGGIAGAWVGARILTVLARRARQGQRVAARLSWVVPAEEPAPSRWGLDRQLDTVISGYRASHALAARVAELEGQLTAPAASAAPAAAKPERAPAAAAPDVAPGVAPGALRSPRARQLSEASFVAGSDALVRVRTAIRLVQDCRLKIDGPGDRRENGGWGPAPAGLATAGDSGAVAASIDPGAEPVSIGPNAAAVVSAAPAVAAAPAVPDPRVLIHDLFRALGAEIQDLTRNAQDLGGAVAGLIAESSANGAIAPVDPGRGDPGELERSALICRALAVELEGGLQRLGAELRLLSHPFVGRSPEAGDRPERNGSDRSLVTGLRRLEGQLEEVADHLGRLTRDAEELSRELDR